MKKCLLLICLILMTGCSARYTIEYNDDFVNENLTVFGVDADSYRDIKNGSYAPVPTYYDAVINLEEPIKVDGVEYYDISGKNNNAYLDYRFNLKNYSGAYFPNLCYDYFKVFEEKDDVIFSTGKKFKCFFPGSGLDKVDIVLKSNHKVLFNNADEVDGDKYIWHITPDRIDSANIQISFSKSLKNNRPQDLSKYLTIGFVAALSVGIVSLIIFIRYKRINKI